MNDRDWYSLPEPKAKKFFRNAVNGVKGTVNFAKKLHAKRVALEKAQDYHEAQRRAKCFKEWKYVQALELHRDKMKNFPELGLKLGDRYRFLLRDCSQVLLLQSLEFRNHSRNRDTTHNTAIFTKCHDRSNRSWRGAPGAHYCS